MTHDQFEALVARLEPRARANPGAYRAAVVALALMGYGYLALVVGLLLVLLALLVLSVVALKALAIKLAIPLAFFVWFVLKALWVRVPSPEGRVLTRAEAPELFALVDNLRRRLRTPPFHVILLTDDFNAGVVQVPRLGPLGWTRNYLMVGLPLMQSLTAEQFEAVLAHEFGHLAGGHGRLSNWIYRLRLAWARLLGAFEQTETSGKFLFAPFFRWYSPFFDAWSFPLARANEYEADRTSVRLTSPAAAAQALTAAHVVGGFLHEKYWPAIHRRADDEPMPAVMPFAHYGPQLASALDPTDAQRWLDGALARTTTVNDTHPALSDRLAALGAAPAIALPAPGGAADRLLGPSRATLVDEFDARWLTRIEEGWRARHEQVRTDRERLAALEEALARDGTLNVEEAFEHARLVEEVGAGEEAALALLRALRATHADHPVIAFALGRRLLDRDDAEGVALMTSAIDAVDDAIVPGSESLRNYHWRAGRKEEARAWHDKAVARQELLAAASKERETVRGGDRFDPHGLAPDALEDLRRQILAVDGVRKAWFVRKRVKHLPESICYTFAFATTPWWKPTSQKRRNAVQQKVLAEVAFPGETIVFCAEGNNSKFAKRVRKAKGSRVV